jgi:hypothetical protein
MVFSLAPLESGASATHLLIPYPGQRTEWRYDPETSACSSQGGCYLRWTDGVAHTDILNGQQLSAANVVIVYATHVKDVRYFEDAHGAGFFSVQIQIWNDPANPERPGGRAQILRDGQVFDGFWSRPGRFDMLKFVDGDGNPIPLKPGVTWFQMVRPDQTVQIEP